MTTEFTIPVTAWSNFHAQLLKMNKKAAKLGCDPITATVLRHEKVKREHTLVDGTQWYTREYECDAIVIALDGTAPRLNGWEFLARVEYLSDGASVLFHSVPVSTGATVDDRFRSLRPDTCEHCCKARRRNDTFIIRNVETGEQKQVGRQCLADFTGINDPRQIGAAASRLHTFENIRDASEHCWRAWHDDHVDTTEALMLTSAYITLYGWVSKAAADATGNQSTSGLVRRHFWDPAVSDAGKAIKRKAREEIEANPLHAQRAGEVVAWIKDYLAQHAKSDYEKNLVTLTVLDLTETHHIGLVCSAVQAYLRHKEREAELNIKRQQLGASQHIGTVGERLRNVAATITTVRQMQTDFGASTLLKFTTVEGNVLTWFASGDRIFTPGVAVVLTGTVKAHKEYEGVKETQLTRAKVA